MAGRVFGLDFGTTNSLLAIVQGEACIPLVDQIRRSGRIPRSFGIAPERWWWAGEAREHLDSADGSAPQGLLRSPKMSLRRDGPIHLEGKDIDPSDAVKEVLSFLRRDALTPRREGNPHQVDRVVMTIPVDFQGHQRRQLRDAARKAGLGIVQFVHEPVAALYAYLRTLPDLGRQLAELENRVLLVFDWGGGTLDLTLCRIMGGTLMQIDERGQQRDRRRRVRRAPAQSGAETARRTARR